MSQHLSYISCDCVFLSGLGVSAPKRDTHFKTLPSGEMAIIVFLLHPSTLQYTHTHMHSVTERCLAATLGGRSSSCFASRRKPSGEQLPFTCHECVCVFPVLVDCATCWEVEGLVEVDLWISSDTGDCKQQLQAVVITVIDLASTSSTNSIRENHGEGRQHPTVVYFSHIHPESKSTCFKTSTFVSEFEFKP